MRNRSLLVLCSLVLAGLAAAPSVAQVRDLSREDRAFVDKILGQGVVGEALPADAMPPVGALPDEWFSRQAVRRVVHGKNKGKDVNARLERIERNGEHGYQLDTGGKTVLYGQIAPDGSVHQTAADDRKEGVITQCEPAVPIFVPHMRPGDRKEVNCEVKVFDLTNPSKQKHSGKMKVTMEYIGNFRVSVPAGTYETACIKWIYKGKVGPADVEDQSYWFFDDEAGPVAWINQTDVSAFLVYQDHSKRASVLVSLKPLGQ